MIRNEKSATRRAPNRPCRPDAPLYKPPCARSQAPTQKPAPIERPAPTKTLAPTERPAPPQRPVPAKAPAPAQATAAPTKKAAPTQPNPAPSQPNSILFDASKSSFSLYPKHKHQPNKVTTRYPQSKAQPAQARASEVHPDAAQGWALKRRHRPPGSCHLP